MKISYNDMQQFAKNNGFQLQNHHRMYQLIHCKSGFLQAEFSYLKEVKEFIDKMIEQDEQE